jgi:hypothetical protein
MQAIGCNMTAVIVHYLEYIVALSRERHLSTTLATRNTGAAS